MGLVFASQLFSSNFFAQAPLPQQPEEQDHHQSKGLRPRLRRAFHPEKMTERIVSPIALYPDPLLAQVLTASTFYNDIPAAAQSADQHHYLSGDHWRKLSPRTSYPTIRACRRCYPFLRFSI